MERIPINEKYSLTIQKASEYFSIGVKRCAGWQKRTWEGFLFSAGTDI